MKEKKQEIFKSKGWQAINRMGIINENYHTLILNYRELMNEIARIQQAQDPFLLLFNNEYLNRYIFNFLASTSALIDSCRSVMLEPFYMYIYAELTQYHKQDFRETIELAAEANVPIPNIYYKLAGYTTK